MKGFIEFIRERAVVGFAVGFLLGGAVTKVVSALVLDIVNPLLGLILSKTKSLETMYFQVAGARVKWGHFVSVLIDFIIISILVYLIVKGLNFERLDKRKEINK